MFWGKIGAVLSGLLASFWYFDPDAAKGALAIVPRINGASITTSVEVPPLVITAPISTVTMTTTESFGVPTTTITDVLPAMPATSRATGFHRFTPLVWLGPKEYRRGEYVPEDGEPFEVYQALFAPPTLVERLSEWTDRLIDERYSPLQILVFFTVVSAFFFLPWLQYVRAHYRARNGWHTNYTSSIVWRTMGMIYHLTGTIKQLWIFLPYLISCTYSVLSVAPRQFLQYRWIETQDSWETLKILARRAFEHSPRRSSHIVKILFGVQDRVEPVHDFLVDAIHKVLSVLYGWFRDYAHKVYTYIRGVTYPVLAWLSDWVSYVSCFLLYKLNWYQNQPTKEEEEYARRKLCSAYRVLPVDWHTAYTTRFADIVHTIAEKRYLQERINELSNKVKTIPTLEVNIEDLEIKCDSLQKSHIKAVKDLNFFRTTLARILSYCFNVSRHVHPSGPQAFNPFLTPNARFSEEADPENGLHYAYHNVREERLQSCKDDFLFHTRKMLLNSKEAPQVFPKFVAERCNNVYFKMDPFEDEGWLLACIFPDIKLPRWKDNENPFDPSKMKLEPWQFSKQKARTDMLTHPPVVLPRPKNDWPKIPTGVQFSKSMPKLDPNPPVMLRQAPLKSSLADPLHSFLRTRPATGLTSLPRNVHFANPSPFRDSEACPDREPMSTSPNLWGPY